MDHTVDIVVTTETEGIPEAEGQPTQTQNKQEDTIEMETTAEAEAATGEGITVEETDAQ